MVRYQYNVKIDKIYISASLSKSHLPSRKYSLLKILTILASFCLKLEEMTQIKCVSKMSFLSFLITLNKQMSTE